jgi:hypothetical protein
MASCVTPESGMIRAQLERILASAPFAASHRSQRFLRYVVENSLTDSVESLKEYAIAVEVFERDSSYDPAIDATVRVEAGRLRSRLRDYYAGEGRNDRLGIEIPKGGYRAFFSERMPSAEPSVASAQIPESAVQSSSPRARGWRRPGALAWSLILASALAGVFGWMAILHRIRQTNAPSQTTTVIRLAVMPISNETGDAAKSYISDGLTDNFIRQRSELPRLRVMARTAVDRVKPADVARALG